MDGGMRAWKGLTAEGPPEAGIAYFAAGTGPADMAALAWALEEGTRQFYTHLAERGAADDAARLFDSLVRAEENHKETLKKLHDSLSAEPISRMRDQLTREVLEGGMGLDEALQWTEGKALGDILELALGLETNAYDRYLKMLTIAEDEESKGVFRGIAGEEKGHLKRLSDLMDQELKRG